MAHLTTSTADAPMKGRAEPRAVRLAGRIRRAALFTTTAVPPFAWLAAFFFLPLAIIFFYSFGENVTIVEIETTWTLENYARIFRSDILIVFWRSLWIAGLATAICIVIGFPVALVIATASPRWKPWLLLLVILPFWTNLLIRTYAMLAILGSRGQLNDALGALWQWMSDLIVLVGLDPSALIGERFVPIQFLGTPLGVILGLVYIFLPFAVLPIYSVLERMEQTYLEASADLGAGHLRTLTSIVIPLAMPGIVTAAIITFIPALGQFLTPELLGRGQVDMIANIIERQFKEANDWPFGSALSMFLLYLTFIILALRSFADARRARSDTA